jgi:hypothetical protein
VKAILVQHLGGRRMVDLALDALFVVWVLHFLVVGRVLPVPITDLLYPHHPVVVVNEPVLPGAPQAPAVPAPQA